MAVTQMYDFTREYYKVPVTITVAGSAIDPTALSVEWAVVISGIRPISTDWKTEASGMWESSSDGLTHWARVLVGDGTATCPIVAPNTYDVFWRITDSPERPARLIGQIQAI